MLVNGRSYSIVNAIRAAFGGSFDEAALVEGVELYPVRSLAEAVAAYCGHGAKYHRTIGPVRASAETPVPDDFADVHEHEGRGPSPCADR